MSSSKERSNEPQRTSCGDLGAPARLAAITRLGLHGHLGDPHLDAIVATAAAACNVPLAMVSIVTPNLQTYVAEVGLDFSSTNVPADVSFCTEVVRTGLSVAVPDASNDPAYRANPLVLAGVIGAYAGEPLVYDGHVIGALSIVDHVAREFTTLELGVLHAQAQLVAAAVRLRVLETWDPLTGLNKRPLLLEHAELALSRRTGGQIVALLVLGVVGLGRLNAALGTPAGDVVLVAVGDRLREACDLSDSIARVGGDEFAVLLDDVVSIEDARTRAATICTAVKGPLLVQEIDIEIEVRCGLTTSSAGSADELLLAAERAASARPSVPNYARAPATASTEVVELADAIYDGQMVLHYHPIVELRTGEVTGVEALVRWQHPERGLIMPLDFISLAEESGLIVELGDWVLRTAAAQAAEWAAGGRPLDVAINVSPLQMAAPTFADHCSALLSAMQVPLERIVLEVTESALLDHPYAAQALTQLRNTGVKLALDDFGTGYSSFSYLRRFPIDIIKIDRSFVAGLGEHPDDDAIVASVVSLAHHTGKTVVAEGVTTTAQLDHLIELGVEDAQGFLWTQPLPVDDLELWLEARRVLQRELSSAPPLPHKRSADDPDGPDEIQILRMHAEGASLHTIAAVLNRSGSRTTAGMRWHVRTVARVIAPSHPRRQAVSSASPPAPSPWNSGSAQ